MATLHVRNVPDGVYEALRRQAEANGRSIGAEAVQLLEQQLRLDVSRRPRRLVRRRRSGFTRFAERARLVLALAQTEARALGHDHVGSGHLLLGLLVLAEGPAFIALESLGLTADRVRTEVAQRTPAAEADLPQRIPFGPDAKKALELALREALSLRRDSIGTQDLLLGIVGEGEAAGAAIVREVEPDVDAVRACVLRAVAEAGASFAVPPAGVPPLPHELGAFRVVELEGSSSEWETRLNEAAADGFELVEVVDRRAIFRRD
jgi:ATP-dependent Clp protease ATP-binding subunit ClpC